MANRRVHVAQLVAVTLLAVAAPLVAAGGPSANAATAEGIGIRLLDAPVERKQDPRAQLYVVDHVAPATRISRRFEVKNGTPNQVTLQLYPSAAEVRQSGWTVLPGRAANELVSWTKVTPSSVALAPGKTATARLEVTVPANASSGERYGVILAEAPANPSAQGLAVATRVGIRMYLDVGTGGEPPSAFAISSLTAQRTPEGQPVVSATIKNTGGRALDMTGSVTLTEGPGGLRAGPFPVDSVRTLAIGATGDVLLKLDKSLPAGPWLARLDMQSGFIKHSATARITFPDTGSAPPVKAKLVEDNKGLPWPLIIGGILGLLALGLILFFFFKRRSRPEDKRDQQLVDVPR